MNFLNLFSTPQTNLNFNLNSLPLSSSGQLSEKVDSSAFTKVPDCEASSFNPEKQPDQDLSISKIMKQRQRLLNQYLQLNIQILQKKIHQKEIHQGNHSEPVSKEDKQEDKGTTVQSNKKKIRKMNSCGHDDRPHYAKGMCNNCYHRVGRVKKPWKCPHEKLYAAGMCQNCYINNYNRKRREESQKLETIKNEIHEEQFQNSQQNPDQPIKKERTVQ